MLSKDSIALRVIKWRVTAFRLDLQNEVKVRQPHIENPPRGRNKRTQGGKNWQIRAALTKFPFARDTRATTLSPEKLSVQYNNWLDAIQGQDALAYKSVHTVGDTIEVIPVV